LARWRGIGKLAIDAWSQGGEKEVGSLTYQREATVKKKKKRGFRKEINASMLGEKPASSRRGTGKKRRKEVPLNYTVIYLGLAEIAKTSNSQRCAAGILHDRKGGGRR